MTTPRNQQLRAVSQALGSRRLVWFGIRGEDASSLLAIPEFSASYSVTARLRAAALEDSVALEDLTNYRVDLDAYDTDLDSSAEVGRLRGMILRSLTRPCAVASYRPSELLSSLGFVCRSSAQMLSMFKDRQRPFEHKPWVETELARCGLRSLEWEYVPVERRARLLRGLSARALVLRPSRASGGVGMALVHDQEQLEQTWRDDETHLMAVAPYLEDAIPLNVNGCVFPDGVVVLHPASVQLIGIAGYTNRRFGYCGNDFAAIKDIAGGAIEELDTATRTIGKWLANMGYLGAFGADYLLHDDRPVFTEVNARMQGSTRMASELAARTEHVDLVVDHVAAFLGLAPAESLTLADWAAELPAAAQVIKHNLKPVPVTAARASELRLLDDARVRLLPDHAVRVEPGGVEYCLEFPRQITRTGFELLTSLSGGDFDDGDPT